MRQDLSSRECEVPSPRCALPGENPRPASRFERDAHDALCVDCAANVAARVVEVPKAPVDMDWASLRKGWRNVDYRLSIRDEGPALIARGALASQRVLR